MMEKEIYLDNSATTPMCDAAIAKYTEVAQHNFGNPSSRHSKGLTAEKAMEEARHSVAAALGAKDGRVVFTSGGTESNNLAILGRAYAKERYHGKRILVSAGEHASVLRPLEKLQSEGFEIIAVPTRGGALDLEFFAKAADRNTILATVMMVNNETGARYDLAGAGRILHGQCPEGVLHCDATQGFLKVPFTVRSLGVDMVTVSSHKVAGPKGVGALWLSAALEKSRGLTSQLLGGGQEGDLRSGTENVSGIAAFGAAVSLGYQEREDRIARMHDLRAYLLTRLSTDPTLAEVLPKLPQAAAPHILNLTLPNIKSETMLNHLSARRIYVSSGSACSSNHPQTSSALLAFGASDREADCSIRVSVCPENTREDIDALCDALAAGVSSLARIHH